VATDIGDDTSEPIRKYMTNIQTVAVFCGGRAGNDPAFRAAASELGRGMARAGIRLVYGGGRVGLMGALADGALAAGGKVIGVIPEFLTHWEVAHDGLSEQIVTDSMHSRKRRMFELSDAFVALPGGLGTLDEIVEIMTWRQLRLHDKPVLICDVAGSAAPLLSVIEAAIAAGFAPPEARTLFERTDGVGATIARLQQLNAAHGGAAAALL
jgi:uncharacterized protein (TIGR00730 family)